MLFQDVIDDAEKSAATDELYKGVTTKDILLVVSAAAMTALFGQFVVALYNWWIARRKRKQIKELIKADLDLALWNLKKMEKVYSEIQENIRGGMKKLLL